MSINVQFPMALHLSYHSKPSEITYNGPNVRPDPVNAIETQGIHPRLIEDAPKLYEEYDLPLGGADKVVQSGFST